MLRRVIHDGYRVTTETALREEAAVLRFARQTRGDFPTLGKLGDWLGAYQLSEEQEQAVESLASSKHGICVLIGDAGTGKTHTLKALNEARQSASGTEFIALVTTTRATQELQANGYPQAATVAAFLASARQQEAAKGAALLIDEAGLLSSKQLAALVAIAEDQGARSPVVDRAGCWSCVCGEQHLTKKTAIIANKNAGANGQGSGKAVIVAIA